MDWSLSISSKSYVLKEGFSSLDFSVCCLLAEFQCSNSLPKINTSQYLETWNPPALYLTFWQRSFWRVNKNQHISNFTSDHLGFLLKQTFCFRGLGKDLILCRSPKLQGQANATAPQTTLRVAKYGPLNVLKIISSFRTFVSSKCLTVTSNLFLEPFQK